MRKTKATHGLFNAIKEGLEDSISYSKGELSLATTIVPQPAPSLTSQKIVSLRKRLRMSQAVFAATLNVRPKTVQSWEQGLRKPSDASLRLLQLVDAKPGLIEEVLGVACK